MVSDRFAFALEVSDLISFSVVRKQGCEKGCSVCFTVTIAASSEYQDKYLDQYEGRYPHCTLWEALDVVSHRAESYSNLIEREYRRQVIADSQPSLFAV